MRGSLGLTLMASAPLYITSRHPGVKILGTLAMIVEGETDWKLLGIDITDPMADKLNDIKDVEEHKPGLLAATVEWFKIYKMPDGKPPNTFAFDAEAKDAAFAKDVVEKLHTQLKARTFIMYINLFLIN